MLFENVMAILNKCRDAELNDVLVAEDMLVAENEANAEAIREAGKFLAEYYEEITKCRRLDKEDKIKEICELADDKDALDVLLKEIEDIEE